MFYKLSSLPVFLLLLAAAATPTLSIPTPELMASDLKLLPNTGRPLTARAISGNVICKQTNGYPLTVEIRAAISGLAAIGDKPCVQENSNIQEGSDIACNLLMEVRNARIVICGPYKSQIMCPDAVNVANRILEECEGPGYVYGMFMFDNVPMQLAFAYRMEDPALPDRLEQNIW